MSERLISLLDNVLGSGHKTSGNNRSYYCPFCNHRKRKLEVQTTTNKKGENPYNCWVCNVKGKRLTSLFKRLNVGQQNTTLLHSLININKRPKDIFETETQQKYQFLNLPPEYKPLWVYNKSPEYKNAFYYVTKKRGLTANDIMKYKIGYCATGDYRGNIVIPSYDTNGQLNFFTTRSYYETEYGKHKNPDVSKDVVGFELFINWNYPVILTEGGFDAVTIKRNVIPLFGKIVLDKLKYKIIKEKVKELYIILDPDALRNAIRTVEYFLGNGVKVYLVELQNEDPNEMGYERITKQIEETEPMTLAKLIKYKMQVGR